MSKWLPGPRIERRPDLPCLSQWVGGLHDPPLRLKCQMRESGLGIPISAFLGTVCLNECGYFMWNSLLCELGSGSGIWTRD